MVEFPTAEEIHSLHERVVARDKDTEPGVQRPAAVESAIVYISEGFFGQRPETIHEKAAHLMRLLAADHPYVDGNKRTALTATAYFYDLNGFTFEADDRVRMFLREFATDASEVDMNRVIAYLREQATERHQHQ
jgi:death on curing protein